MAKGNPNHDFNPAIEKTSAALARVIVNQMAASADGLFFELKEKDATTEEEIQKQNADFTSFMVSVIKIISSTDIPMDYAAYPLDRVIGLLEIIKNQVNGVTRETEDELMSRFIGVRSPRTGKFARDTATFAQVIAKLQEVREATGNKASDYNTNIDDESVPAGGTNAEKAAEME